ncbi:MAG: TIGR00282 family metallophosphoesterase [Deltaproteobacteria bacterium]|nr:TIGR00282 family metallophosphoesterase [Deltaproteobacteria bacterium]
MKLAFFGDICGSAGRQALRKRLNDLKSEFSIDIVLANAENAAGGMGVTPEVADELFDMGIHVLTSGNHIWKQREIYPYLDENPNLLRPLNYPDGVPGRGLNVYRKAGIPEVAVINLQGRVFMPPVDCPFLAAERALAEMNDGPRVRIIDFHAEATSEKVAMGWFLDGRVSAVLGTHTHIQTADEQVLPGGTGYITDLGMTGSVNSILGMKKGPVLHRFLTGLPERFSPARKNPVIMGALLHLDPSTGACRSIQRLRVPVEE